MELAKLIAVARGDAEADLVLAGGQVVNVFTGQIERADVAIAGSHVAGLGPGYRSRERVELDGAYVAPGFIDAHVHIESSMVPPREFASVVVPRGVTAVVADPHEIANVLGLAGIRFMLDDARDGPLTVFIAAPSCVPSTPLATAGATLPAADLAVLRSWPEVAALGEVMDYPGVVGGERRVLDKIRAFAGLPLDGHCPRLAGQALNAYVAAGIESDHESTELEEARAKLARGLIVFIREGTAARNLRSLLPLVSPTSERRLCFCTDDRQLPDLIGEGSIDHLVRSAIALGVDPIVAIRMATLNVAERFRLRGRGAVAPGHTADLVVFRQLRRPEAEQVYSGGRLVARDGRMLSAARRAVADSTAPSTVNVDWARVELAIPARGARVRAIGVVPDQLRTESVVTDGRREGGLALSDPANDLVKLAVIERHRASGRVGLGFVRGLGLRRGAIASTVAHDHHNLIVAGADDASMMTAARAVSSSGGGLAVAEGDTVRAQLPLPIAGLMSALAAGEVAHRLEGAVAAARALGSGLRDPFMTLSFLGLEVIPALKLTDQGLVDVERMEIVPLFLD